MNRDAQWCMWTPDTPPTTRRRLTDMALDTSHKGLPQFHRGKIQQNKMQNTAQWEQQRKSIRHPRVGICGMHTKQKHNKKTWNKAIQLCDGLTFLLHHMQMHECWMLCVWVCFVVYTWVLSKYESALATWAKAKWIICLFVSDNCDFFFIYARLSSPCFCFLSLPSSWKHTWFVFFSLLSFVWHNPRLKYACVACARFAIYRVYRVSVILIFSMFFFFCMALRMMASLLPFSFFFSLHFIESYYYWQHNFFLQAVISLPIKQLVVVRLRQWW